MKKLLLLVTLSTSLFSCQKRVSSEEVKFDNYTGFEVIEYDGCEYLINHNRFTHKGNCKNSIHCYNL